MAYGKDGYPTEYANKVGHVRLIKDSMIQSLIEAFEDHQTPTDEVIHQPTGQINIDGECPIEQVITIDGGHQAVPNIVRPERQVGFIQIASQLIKIETIENLREHSMTDPRQVREMLSHFTHHVLAALPMTGVHIPGLSVRESIREAIHRFLNHYQLYNALSYLVYRQWERNPIESPSMDCIECGVQFELPRNTRNFPCPRCEASHRLSDYLGLCAEDSEDRPRAEVISNFRSVLEALILFSLIIKFRERSSIMRRTLFLLDGPLLLRAQLSRLVEPIRALIADQRDRGLPLYLVGVEKSGELSDFADACSGSLKNVGDFFLPSTQFIVEEIHGRAFNENTYRNRVNYGAKVVTRVGTDHSLALNVPTGDYLLTPNADNLIGFDVIVRSLSQLLSYSYDNALIPIVLINAEASISNQPSGGILAQFVDSILGNHE